MRDYLVIGIVAIGFFLLLIGMSNCSEEHVCPACPIAPTCEVCIGPEQTLKDLENQKYCVLTPTEKKCWKVIKLKAIAL